MSGQATTQFTVGRLFCREVRDYLKQREFMCRDIEWIESNGVLDRTFAVRGSDEAIREVSRALSEWSKQLE